jgi:hypothetical protein
VYYNPQEAWEKGEVIGDLPSREDLVMSELPEGLTEEEAKRGA